MSNTYHVVPAPSSISTLTSQSFTVEADEVMNTRDGVEFYSGKELVAIVPRGAVVIKNKNAKSGKNRSSRN